MMALGFDWHGAVNRANRNTESQREIAQEHAMRLAGLGYQEKESGLQDRAFARGMAERQMAQGDRQFDVRMNLLREILANRRPSFYGDGAEPVARGGGGVAMSVGGSGRRGGGFMPFGADEETGAPVNNFLARLMMRS